MSTAEESPAQRAARERRERREAKIKAGGSARLDKITSLSGRTPQSAPHTQAPSQRDRESTEAIQAQQEAFRALLRQAAPEAARGQQGENETEDPTAKLLSSLLEGVPGNPNSPPGAEPAVPSSKLASIATSLGVPPFLAKWVGDAFSEPQEDPKSVRLWKGIHLVFALGMAIYVVWLVRTSVALFGFPRPKPATAQNPYIIFQTGEFILFTTKLLLGGPFGIRSAFSSFRGVIGDAMIVLFVLGAATWWTNGWEDIALQA
ncbi:hypothetical protein N7468_006867 [Penicillium chermesinum]|uniref:GET complex, subunit GET2 n=1 Tax=Penicillium chermesinum TaxID=63820 RepID=A0A9W9NT04_9EURO|nr:uncharacterized protein N7468_006867 [Penicillium chermesinum]KAJ5225642.1 hypothetical protein N7468_006867 [Penicillium chermesinum]